MVECPYCKEEVAINHDDGFGYSEDEKHQIECSNCKKHFVFTTTMIFYYHVAPADCLNDVTHEYKLTKTIPKEFSSMECSMCGDTRELTEAERKEFQIPSKESYMKMINRIETKLINQIFRSIG
jgi:hypothetical protein